MWHLCVLHSVNIAKLGDKPTAGEYGHEKSFIKLLEKLTRHKKKMSMEITALFIVAVSAYHSHKTYLPTYQPTELNFQNKKERSVCLAKVCCFWGRETKF